MNKRAVERAEALLDESLTEFEESGLSVEEIASRVALRGYGVMRDCCGPKVALEWLLAVTSSALEVDG